MSRLHPTSALRAALRIPIAMFAAPLALAQLTPDPAHLTVPSCAPQGDVKSYGPSALTPELLTAIQLRDAADLAVTLPRAASQPQREPKPDVARRDATGQGPLQHVLVDANAVPGEVWAAGRGWKAAFSATGMAYFPRLGAAAPRNMPTSFELARVTRGGEPLALRAASVRADGHSVALERGALREVYHLAVDSVEQTFVFDTLVGEGDLVLDVAVASEWQVVPGEEFIRFVDPTYGEVRYGRAYAIDATGARIELSRAWTGEGIALTVPASFLADAVLPLTVDPVIGSNVWLTLDDDESSPDACYEATSGSYWMAYQDYFSATDVDVFIARVTASGAVGTTYSIDITGDYWIDPAIAASPANHSLLIVASTTPDGPGSANADIEGRFFDTVALAAGSLQFEIDGVTHNCVKPDVGGSWDSAPSVADFCVVWQRDFSATDVDVLARVVRPDGTFRTAVISVANSGADSDFAPAVSKSRGDESFDGDYWNIAWIRDNAHNGFGTPYSHRIYFTGAFNGATEQVVLNTLLASHVDVSSTFDATVPGLGERPFIVTYDRGTNNGDIYATVCTQLGALQSVVVSLMEDFDASLLARDPSIATDGTSFFLAYDELWWYSAPGSEDFDTYALSGNLGYGPSTAYIALSERHQSLQYTGGAQLRCQVASQGDGGGLADDALVVWEDRVGGGAHGGTIGLAVFDSATGDSSIYQAIGAQYCIANSHFDSYGDGRGSSFIAAFGSASVNVTQQLTCVDMKLDAFAYFLVSASSGNVNLAGGSLGRLCLGGSIGRRVGGSILHTGSAGAASTTFHPLFLPAPNGSFSAAPGQTLYFQCWHRDTTLGGAASSNFSNACAVTFRP